MILTCAHCLLSEGVYAWLLFLSAGSNGTMKPPSFAVRMKPVAFNIKPKVGVVSTSATKQPTKDAVTDQAALASEATVKPDYQQPSSAVTSLGLAYGSSEDDFE
jgi:hypothetical protein